jgi:superfamily I DNA and RNA helicase
MHSLHAKRKETAMKLELQSAGLRLAPGQMLKVRDGAGSTVCALEGSVWITEENQTRDVVLQPGRCYRLRNTGLAIVHALGGGAAVALS